MNTRFTPYAMLRLFADQLPQIPDRILYLDDDIVIRGDITTFYNEDINGIELVGVLDYWGRFFFHNLKTKRAFDYLNSGVLLLNMKKIKQTGLFAEVRHMMQVKQMFLPDQSAINKLAVAKRVAPRRYNEQYHLQKTPKFNISLLALGFGLISILKQLSHGMLIAYTVYFIYMNMMICLTNISNYEII